jgi:formylglycine-generating enzyme required for sulfatase activity
VTITATSVDDPTKTATITVEVVALPVISTFTNAGLDSSGNNATLTVVFTGGTGSVDNAIGLVVTGVPVSLVAVSPLTTNTTFTLTVTNLAGTSVQAATTVAPLPVFTTNPAPQAWSSGGTATFTVVATAPSAITGYAWERSDNGGSTWAVIGSATTASYTTPVLGNTDAGALFRAIATNTNGPTTSMPAGLTKILTLTVNSTPFDFVLVPIGAYMMGEAEQITHSVPQALPAHPVTFAKAFYMAQVPCTQAQWKAIMGGSNPSAFTELNGYDLASGYTNDPSFLRPVDSVDYPAITAATTGFLAQLNTAAAALFVGPLAGAQFRLPTEAEYEYACRAGSSGTSNFYFGSYDVSDSAQKAVIELYGWFDSNSGNATHIVKEKLPNAWGLYDMIGNLWEATEDNYHASYAATGTGIPTRPDDGTAWVDSPSGPQHSYRGGSWQHGVHFGESKYRGPYPMTPGDPANPNMGFRVVLVLP